jgi:hypothetical protein
MRISTAFLGTPVTAMTVAEEAWELEAQSTSMPEAWSLRTAPSTATAQSAETAVHKVLATPAAAVVAAVLVAMAASPTIWAAAAVAAALVATAAMDFSI